MPRSKKIVIILASLTLLFGGVVAAQEKQDKQEPQREDKQQASDTDEARKAAAERGKAMSGKAAEEEKKAAKKKAPQPQKATGAAAAAPTSSTTLPRKISPAVLATRVDPRSGDEVIVITNDALERTYGRSSAKATGPDYSAFEDKSGKGPSKGKGARARPAAKADPTQRIAKIQAEIDRLRKKLLGLRNPLLPRGKSTDEEVERDKGKDNAARVDATKRQIRDLEEELLRLQSR